MKILLNGLIATALGLLTIDVCIRTFAFFDSRPVYVVLEEPQTLTPYIKAGGLLEVRWWGYYRRSCGNLRYTRWIGYYRDGEIVLEKTMGSVAASSGKRTDPASTIFTMRIPEHLEPGVYFWRSVEIADCGHSIHYNHLDDAWFEVIKES